MSSFTTSNTSTPLQYLTTGLFALLLLAFTAAPAQAQMDDGELPSIDFSVNLMQSGQYITIDRPDGVPDDPITGFHFVRAGLTANVQFSENVSGLLMLQQEPNDFGLTFGPAVDFAILDLQLSDNITFRTGTPVTGLMNFRGYSDGPVVQGNPLIGNSPADMITAGQGVKLIGSYDAFGFDLTINRNFIGTLTTESGGNTGVDLIGKFRYTGSDVFKFGAGVATHTGTGQIPNGHATGPTATRGLIFANGDRDNYNVTGGNPSSSTNTHANIPSGTILHADAKVTGAGADVDLWGGYATEGDTQIYGTDNDYQAFFAGIGLKYNLTEDFYGAGRFTFVSDQSDAVSDADETSLSRIQLGIGYEVYDNALFKLEYVNQSEGESTALSRVGQNWQGVTTELSFNF